MKTKISLFITTLIVIAVTALNVKSQISISNIPKIGKVRKGITYIAMKDPASEKAKAYVEIFKNNWTISKFEFIKYSEIEKYLSPENSFLSIGGYETSTQFVKLYENGSSKNGINYASTHLYLELWTCDEKSFEKNKKKFGNKDKVQIARIELFTDFPTLSDPDLLYQSDYDGNGHIRNWGPGILKNYVQALMGFLTKSESRTLFAGIANAKELKILKKEVLYVPDYVLIKFNKMTGDETKKHEEKEIFEDYAFKYKLIPVSELNEKIVNEKTAFYYLIYIKSSTDKYLSVINSLTGDIIYTTYSPMSYNIRSGDLQELSRKIEGSN